MSDQFPIEVAIAILPYEGKFLMQLRDNIPTILYPGLWGLFGGHIEAGETPEVAVEREVLEEIGYQLKEPKKFACYSDDRVIRHIFYAPLTVDLDRLVLTEGWDFGLITPAQIEAGVAYSAIAGEERPLGIVHQQIMLDFIEWWS
ncbi:NUDIX hydrolase [Chamaesiphon sp. OTE_75_metabat_556]|jgi:8-oxo-dGTP diphosphatase|uniref:NUDIX hydrolase n=1 Tax=Chamaesiphon sp. OTE_75_metabat_556 TaxID=2964692 RepID=UPI00286A0106|nr:NUDIX hydrolase [Chamaesiphon sp. OTE_75_metabat_556]